MIPEKNVFSCFKKVTQVSNLRDKIFYSSYFLRININKSQEVEEEEKNKLRLKKSINKTNTDILIEYIQELLVLMKQEQY